MDLVAQQLTSQFYQWELLGRGWIRADVPICLEPPFTPFFGHFPWKEREYVDDGIKHTLISGLLSSFKRQKLQQPTQPFEISYTPFLFDTDDALTTLHVHVQKGSLIAAHHMEQFFSMLSYCTNPISFEIIGSIEKIIMQIVCREQDAKYVEAQVRSCFPMFGVTISEDDLCNVPEEAYYATTDFGLEQEFMRPLTASHHIDSLSALFSMLEHLEDDQKVIYQILFNGLVNKWENSILRSVSDGGKGSFFEDAPEMPAFAKQKISKPLLAVNVRVLLFDTAIDNALSLLDKVAFAIQRPFSSAANALIALLDQAYLLEQRMTDIYFRKSHRLGMLLNTEELTLLAHFPTPVLQTKKVIGQFRKTKSAPAITTGHQFCIGMNEHQGEERNVTLSPEIRLKHTHIIGATGTGKSTLLLSMIAQDSNLGNGFAVLDPHGDLIESVLNQIPEHRIQDVILIDPADAEFPVGFNILKAHSEIEKETLTSDLVSSFKRLSTSWGDQMHSILSNAILTFLESSTGGTLLDLRRFLLEPTFRNEFLKTVSDYGMQYYWQKQYPLLKSGSIGPILTRLDNFMRSRLIRNMVAQRQGVDFEHILDSGKILLVKLSQGLIGEENSYLMGSFIVSKIHQAALARQSKAKRKDFFFYIDEFQHFITPSMEAILSGARKYHLGLILAHQDMQQLAKGDTGTASSLLANAGTRICFRVSDTDANRLADGFSTFDAQDLQNLNIGEAIVRVEKPENDFSLSVIPVDPMDHIDAKDQIITYSRNQYAIHKDIVEESLFKNIQVDFTEPGRRTPEKHSTEFSRDQGKKLYSSTSVKQEVQLPEEHNIAEVTYNLIKKKEQTQHRYLQNLIKRVAESKGYKATIEAPVPTGDGKVDVLLEHTGITIACEVCVTTNADWELHNIEKCLAAGYSQVISCVHDAKTKNAIQNRIDQTFNDTDIQRIKVLEAESLVLYLDTLTVGAVQTETSFKGYRIKVTHNAVSTDEQQSKKEAVARVVAESLRKMKK